MSDKTQVVVEIADGEVISVLSNRENVEVNIIDNDVLLDDTFKSPLFTEVWEDEDGKEQSPMHFEVKTFEAEVDVDRVTAVSTHNELRTQYLDALRNGEISETIEVVIAEVIPEAD